MKRSLILFVEHHTRPLRWIASQRFPDRAMGPFNWFHSMLLRSNIEKNLGDYARGIA